MALWRRIDELESIVGGGGWLAGTSDIRNKGSGGTKHAGMREMGILAWLFVGDQDRKKEWICRQHTHKNQVL